MPGEFGHRGYNAGIKSANDYRNEIKKCETGKEISLLAAAKMEIFKKMYGEWYCDEPAWRQGFWDGFVTRAEDIKGVK